MLLNNYIRLKVEEPENKTKTGILLAEKSKTYPPIGTVLETGDTVTDVKKGDKVVFLRFAALDGLEEGEKYILPKHLIEIVNDKNGV